MASCAMHMASWICVSARNTNWFGDIFSVSGCLIMLAMIFVINFYTKLHMEISVKSRKVFGFGHFGIRKI